MIHIILGRQSSMPSASETLYRGCSPTTPRPVDFCWLIRRSTISSPPLLPIREIPSYMPIHQSLKVRRPFRYGYTTRSRVSNITLNLNLSTSLSFRHTPRQHIERSIIDRKCEQVYLLYRIEWSRQLICPCGVRYLKVGESVSLLSGFDGSSINVLCFLYLMTVHE